MGAVLSSKKCSLFRSPWFLSWIIYVKSFIRRGTRHIPDPKRSSEAVFYKLQTKMASPSHMMDKIKEKLPDIAVYREAALENLKEKVNSVPETLSQIKQKLPDVPAYSRAALENFKDKAEFAFETAQMMISDASSSSMARLGNLKEKFDSVFNGLKDEILPGIVLKARSKLNFLSIISSQIPTQSDVIKVVRLYFWKVLGFVVLLYSAKIIIRYLLLRFEDFLKWILKKSDECLQILLKKIWSLIVQGIKCMWNKIKQKWQNTENRSERQDTDSEAEADKEQSNYQNNKQIDASSQTDFIYGHPEETGTHGIIVKSGEKCSKCQHQLMVAKVGNVSIQVCMNSQCLSYPRWGES